MATENLSRLMHSGVDYLNIVISRQEILSRDISIVMATLSQLLNNSKLALHFKERVDITFDGYNDIPDELWEIPEVRNYVYELDRAFPFWFFFLSKNGSALYVILKCYLLPFLTPEADNTENTPRIQTFLDNHFLAMNGIGNQLNISYEENIAMSNRVFKYFFGE